MASVCHVELSKLWLFVLGSVTCGCTLNCAEIGWFLAEI